MIMTCEYLENPIGVQNQTPRFGWKLSADNAAQKSYHICVFEGSSVNDKCVWDSGIINENRSWAIEYQGQKILSRKTYTWSLSIVLQDNTVLENTSWFETGIFETQEWKAKWIQASNPKQGESPCFRCQFTIDRIPEKGKVHISGLGYYELYINGNRVGDNFLDPGWTDFNKRILYMVYDVTSYLIKGDNVIGIMLGEGWYSNLHPGFLSLIGEMPHWNGIPKVICELDLFQANGTWNSISTGDDRNSWYSCGGPVVTNNIYDGETYDSRLEQDGWAQADLHMTSEWKSTINALAPCQCLTAQMQPPIKVIKNREPVYIAYAKNNAVVIDFGQNIAGWVKINVTGKCGQKVNLKYAELLDDDGGVSQKNLRNAKAADCYILKGSGNELYHPRFTYHGFRYVQIETDAGVIINEISACEVHSDVEKAGSFSCDLDILNKIQNAVCQTELNNLHSVPTDCPQRDERLAWLNDMTVRFEEALFNNNMMLFYEKWLNDISDAQDADSGCIPDTAPFFFGGKSAFHISSVYILLPWYLYLFYGDRQPLQRHYEGLKRYVQFKVSQCVDHGLISEKYFGEWAAPMTECYLGWGENAVPKKIAAQLVTSGYLYYDCMIMKKAASLLGRTEDLPFYEKTASDIAQAINTRYLNKEEGCYEPNVQGNNVFPIFLGIVPKEQKQKVLEHLLKDLQETRKYHCTTGNQMTKYLFEVLRLENQNETALKVASSETYPSIGFMISKGATTIWERWEYLTENNMNSHDHPMLGAFSVWFYKALSGICDESGLTGTISVKPAVPDGLNQISVSYETVCGTLKINWRRKLSDLSFEIEVPWNTMVDFTFPEGWVGINGEKQLRLSSGNYAIQSFRV